MLVKIKRQKSPDSKPYWQTFSYDGDAAKSVGAVLDALNAADDLRDTDGNSADRIRWECSCSQKMCGACAMVINGTPSLACSIFLRDLKGDEVVLEPLSKFPVIADLAVDRSIIDRNLQKAQAYLGEYRKTKPKDYPHLYSTSKCLKCGLCLEVCPNYVRGEQFFGAQFANESYLLETQSADRKKELKKEYAAHFAAGCSKSLACVKVCPAEIDTLSSIAKMNR